MAKESSKSKTLIDVFVEGARRGIHVSMNSMAPNVIFAFILIHILELTGLLEIIGSVCEPLMAIFGLPGVAATVLISAWLSTGGGCGAAASLFTAGELNGYHLAILLPAIMLLGSQIQYMGRLLGTADVKPKYYPHLFAICIINALLAMFVMNIIMKSHIFG